MTINELQIQLDLNQDNRAKLLNEFAFEQSNCFLFVDSDDGNCYLFSKDGNQIGISNLEQIEDEAFYNCTSLKSIQIPDSVKSIGNWAFYDCASLASIEIPDSVESIGEYAFSYCISLTSIKIPDSVKSIGTRAFYNCKSLKSIKIPDSIESIEYWAFEYCKSLKEVLFKGKTIEEVKDMDLYPWGIRNESIIKCC